MCNRITYQPHDLVDINTCPILHTCRSGRLPSPAITQWSGVFQKRCILSVTHAIPCIYGSQDSLPCQQSSPLTHIHPFHLTPPLYLLRSILILSFHLRLSLPSGIFRHVSDYNFVHIYHIDVYVLHGPPTLTLLYLVTVKHYQS
jgi:hypothetical protein